MTCIIGLVENGKVYMGGDSAGVAGYSITTRKDSKVFKNKDFLMGFTTSFRMGQLLQYRLTLPEVGDDIERYMCTDFIDAVRTTLNEYGYGSIESNKQNGGQFLVGYKDRLFKIDTDYHVGWSDTPFFAIGCADEIANGAMHVLHGIELLSPKKKITKALEAAAYFSAGVVAPFTIMHT